MSVSMQLAACSNVAGQRAAVRRQFLPAVIIASAALSIIPAARAPPLAVTAVPVPVPVVSRAATAVVSSARPVSARVWAPAALSALPGAVSAALSAHAPVPHG